METGDLRYEISRPGTQCVLKSAGFTELGPNLETAFERLRKLQRTALVVYSGWRAELSLKLELTQPECRSVRLTSPFTTHTCTMVRPSYGSGNFPITFFPQASLHFCSECNNLLYPKAEQQRRTMVYACRICPSVDETVDSGLVYRNDLLNITKWV